MRRTWLVIPLWLLLAAPAAAQQAQAGAQANVQAGGSAGWQQASAAKEGFLLGARLVVDSPGWITVLGIPVDVDLLPRYYAGYRMGKLGFVVGLHVSSVSVEDEEPGGDDESRLFLFVLSPQILYEITASGSVALDLFAGPVLGFGSQETDPGGGGSIDTSIFGFGLDAGVRAIGYLVAGLGLHADVGFHLAFANFETDEVPNDDDEVDTSAVGFYGAIGVMGTI